MLKKLAIAPISYLVMFEGAIAAPLANNVHLAQTNDSATIELTFVLS